MFSDSKIYARRRAHNLFLIFVLWIIDRGAITCELNSVCIA